MNRCDKCNQELGKEAKSFYEQKVNEEKLKKEREQRDFINNQKEEMKKVLLEERAEMEERYASTLLQAKKDKQELDKKKQEIESIKTNQQQELTKYKEEHDKLLNDRLNKEKQSIKLQHEEKLIEIEQQKKQLQKENLDIKEQRDEEVRLAISKEKENNRLSNEMKEKKHQLELSKIRQDAQKLLSDSRSVSSELSGEMLEETIKDYLEDWFASPLYLIEDISKGRKGGDHLISVRVDGEIVGKIKIETKNTKKWEESWINKLSEDMTDYNANYGVLISKSEPKYFESPWFTKNDHISICNLKSKNAIKSLIESYLNILLAIHKAKKLISNESSVSKCVTDWIESPRLKQSVHKLYRSITDNDDDIGKDERAFLKSIRKRKAKSELERQALMDIFLPLEELELKEINFFDEDTK